MKQMLHILKKDVRCFRIEILLVFLSAILSVRNSIPRSGDSQPAIVSALFWIAGTVLISMVIHAEAIPGRKLHWLTRPYEWKSLAAEKLLFLFLFVGLPPALVMFVSLEGVGFSLREFLPSLLFRELLMFLIWIVPLAALAAVTESLVSFFVGLLFVTALSTTLSGVFCCSPTQLFPSEVIWVPASFAGVILVCGAVTVLFIQYKRRWTALGRGCVAATVAFAVVTTIFTPFALGMEFQSWFSRAGIDHSGMEVSLTSETFATERSGFFLTLKGTPPGLAAHADALAGEVVDSDGNAIDFSTPDAVPANTSPAGTVRMRAYMSAGDIQRLRGKPVTVRGSAYVTLFTAPRSFELNLTDEPKTVVEGVRCGSMRGRYWYACWAMLGSPRGKLSVIPVGGERYSMGSGSYWRFPSIGLSPYTELQLNGVLSSMLAPQPQSQTVEFHYTEAVSHFWVNFDIPIDRFLD